ncbi:hypothetical protein [Paenibacillus herberti]|uniref:Uncharacterized protein n=1 Tax=Paenibacillus herberti TaxID=1619309 RepID=A0A229P296_9BACL|nr:hypothetical protein [Paenibacillus herberti]OXM16039.1 hypothetical protein CGZ75_04875 [Paenibacillus herberti]
MTIERAGINNFKGSKLGMILVLFILLVIATQTFSKSHNKPGGPIGIEATQIFRVINESENFWLQLRENYVYFESPPLDSWLQPNGKHFFEQDITREISRCGYQIYQDGRADGYIRFETLTLPVGSTRYNYFTNIEWTNDEIDFVQYNVGPENGEYPTLRIYDRMIAQARGSRR